MTSTMDTQEPQEAETEETPKRGKSPLKRLKDRIVQLDSLSRNKGLKAHTQAAVALEAASIERLLYNDAREDKNSETLAQLATLTAQHEQDTQEIARLTQALAQANAQARTPERIPDSTSALQQEITVKDELLKAVATLARSVDIDERTRTATRIIMQYEKQAQTTVTNLGVDFNSLSLTLKEPSSELLSRLEQAQRAGPMTPVYRAALAVKYEVQVDGHGKQQSSYAN